VGKTVQLQAADGHILDAYRADPAEAAKGGLVVVQEAFGVNEHIRAVCDQYASHGFCALAPAIYDRQQRDATFGYDEASTTRARVMRANISYDQVLLDVAATIGELRGTGPAGVVGYCVGGSAAWLAACRLDPACAVCYYPSDIGKQTHERPRCPVMLHFAERDRLIPLSDVNKLRKQHPSLPVHVYPADHGFNNWHRPASYDAESATLALERTLEFVRRQVAPGISGAQVPISTATLPARSEKMSKHS
jgi:carboxymethylenebutenolidase